MFGRATITLGIGPHSSFTFITFPAWRHSGSWLLGSKDLRSAKDAVISGNSKPYRPTAQKEGGMLNVI